MRVCVIGAGFAGLVAATTLADRGVEPVVVEARGRVGGRVFSQQLANDAVAELVEAVQDQVAGLVRMVGSAPDRLTGRSAAQVLAELPLDPAAGEAIAARLQVTWGRPVEQLAGSAPALERLGVDQGPARWVERLRALRPDLALADGGAVLATWSDDPWSGGAFSTRAVGARPRDDELLARPVDRLHFAGEHTAGKWAGHMEGALRSGLRAAGEVPGLANATLPIAGAW